MPDLITYDLDRGVATITMDDGKANALSLPMLAGLHAAFSQAESDRAVVVLSGREGVFSGGFHLPTMRAKGPERRTMLRSGFDLAMRMLAFPTPVVLACTGHAVAQGAIVLLCADERIGAAGGYKVALNEVAIGLYVARSMAELARYRLHPSHLHRTFALSEPYVPDRAVDAGFLDRVVDPGDVAAVAQDVARRYTSLDMKVHAATKLLLRDGLLRRMHELIDVEFPLPREDDG